MIRDARASDADGIAAIWNPIIRDTAITFNSTLKSAADLQALVTSAPAFVVSERDGTITGFAFFTQFRGGPGYARTMELSIHLAPGMRGQGIGRALIGALVTRAEENGIGSLWAGVAGENPGSVAFHQRCGFETVAVLPKVGFKFGRWMDLTLMRRRLTALDVKNPPDGDIPARRA